MWSLIGHEWAETYLMRHLQAGQVRHAYLITGAEGVGKRALALHFARALHCEEGSELCSGGEQGCRPCRQIESLAYPDLHVVEPEAHISVQQIRELERELHLKPFAGHSRTALLIDFHLATISASNALLKTLEEPPESAVLVLTALTRESLLPTISSRCEVLHLRPVQRGVIQGALRERGASAEQAAELAHISAGLPERALELWGDQQLREDRRKWLDDLVTLLQADLATRFAYASQLTHQQGARAHCTQALEQWLGFSRDAIMFAHHAQAALVAPDFADTAKALTKQLSPEQVRGLAASIDHAILAIGQNANPRLTVEHLMMEMPYCPSL